MSTTIDEARGARRRPGDAIFKGTAVGAALIILLALAGVAIFLLYEGVPGIVGAQEETGGSFVAYVWPLVYGTLVAAIIALILATPLAFAMALVISHYAPKRLAKPLGYVVDLLAAVPSVVYGVWGIVVLGPQLVPLYRWLAETVPWIPFFAGPASTTGRTIFTAGVVLAIMILPIVTAICREIFAQTPTLHQEAALALGATRWEMIRMTVFPYARSGMISAVMLGLGRALGETMAVALVLSASGVITLNFISNTNPSTIAANIALRFPEATGLGVNILIASGLVLFAITFAVNFTARAIAGRSARRMSR